MRRLARNLQKPFRAHINVQYIQNFRRLATVAPATLPEPVQPTRTSIRLRDYQEECIQSVLSYLEKGGRRAGISLATGSGKTVIFTQLIDRVKASSPDATQTLILAHRRELVEQAALHCENAYPTQTVEIEMGNIHASGAADITVATVSSIISGDRIKKFDPQRFKLVLVDEAHHIAAASYMETLDYFGLLHHQAQATESSGSDLPAPSSVTVPTPVLVGVSATFSRFDGVRLSDAIDHIVYHKDYVDMIGDKWLSDVIFTTVQSKADLSGVKHTRFKDFQIGDLSKAVNNPTSNDITVRTWINKAAGRKSTLVFCVDLSHVTDLTAIFRSHGIDAKFVTGDTQKSLRSQRLDSFRNGDFPVLLNCGVFTEGTDIPNIDCILLARPTKSRNLLVQMIGRGMRLYPGKENCHIIDMVSSLGTGVVTTPTLFGLDPAALVNEANVKELREQRESKALEAEREEEAARTVADTPSSSATQIAHKITFTDYDSVHDLIGDTSAEKYVRNISNLAWVRVRQYRYVLSDQSGDYVTIEAPGSGEEFSVTYVKRIRDIEQKPGTKAKSPYMRPQVIAKSLGLSDAVHAADTFASKRFPWPFVNHGQAWRKAPATEGQLAFINKLRPMADQLTAEMVSKGKATDMITKIKFGARGWFSEMEDDSKKKHRGAESLKEREQVKVGPLAATESPPRPKIQASNPAPTLGNALTTLFVRYTP